MNPEPTTSPVRWGILGAGSIAGKFATDIRLTDVAEVVAVASRDGGRAEEFAQTHSIPRTHNGYESLLTDPNVDIVYIATPHSFHHEHALAVLRSGKAAFVEKPFTVTADEAEELRSEASTQGVFLMEALWTVCNPLVQQLAGLIKQGAIGDVLSITANVGPMGIPAQRGGGSRFEDPSLGASFMLECLSYPLWLATTLNPALQNPRRIDAAATFSPIGIDETASILVSGSDGTSATVGGGFAFEAGGGPTARLQVTGTQGWAEIVDDVFNPTLIHVGTRDGLQVLQAEGEDRGFAWEIEEASNAFRSGRLESPLVPLSQSVAVMNILDSARDLTRSYLEESSIHA